MPAFENEMMDKVRKDKLSCFLRNRKLEQKKGLSRITPFRFPKRWRVVCDANGSTSGVALQMGMIKAQA
jgi:hypothetical protein